MNCRLFNIRRTIHISNFIRIKSPKSDNFPQSSRFFQMAAYSVVPRRSQRLIDMRSIGSSTRLHAKDLINACDVNHDKKSAQFCIDVGDHRAFLEYELDGRLLRILHTDVPKELGGCGVGNVLAKAALEFVAKNKFELEIECGFVKHFVNKYEPKYKEYMKE